MKYQKKVVDGKAVIFSSDWILDLENQTHFSYYWNQLSLIYKCCSREEQILEIGVGTSLLNDVLRRRKFKTLTLDIDSGKNPDFCVNALDFDYQKENIETVLAFEIFEHIPFDTFRKVIDKLSNSSVNKIIFSVPWCEYSLSPIRIKLPKLPPFEPRFSIPRNSIGTPAHFWELTRGSKNIRLSSNKLLLSIRSLQSLFLRNHWTLSPAHRVGSIQFFLARR